MHKKRIFKFFRNTLTVALAVSMMCGDLGTSLGIAYASEKVAEETDVTENAVNANDYNLPDNCQDGTILHCFDWKYEDIKKELPNIAAAGFTSVQTSPAQQGCGKSVWYELYQPEGFWIDDSSTLGSKAQLKELCTEAEKYGIKVIVDAIGNHLAGDHTNIDGDLKDAKYWHNSGYTSDGKNGTKKIDWKNRWQVTHGDVGMPDLNTEDSLVQQKASAYIDELMSVGVDGIRWDTAKHISLPSEGCDFWKAVVKSGLYSYGEILAGPTDDTDSSESKKLMKEYTDYIKCNKKQFLLWSGTRSCYKDC